MSFFAFKRNADGEIVVSDNDVLEAVELLINQLMLLNERFEEAFETGIIQEDVTP